MVVPVCTGFVRAFAWGETTVLIRLFPQCILRTWKEIETGSGDPYKLETPSTATPILDDGSIRYQKPHRSFIVELRTSTFCANFFGTRARRALNAFPSFATLLLPRGGDSFSLCMSCIRIMASPLLLRRRGSLILRSSMSEVSSIVRAPYPWVTSLIRDKALFC